MHLCFVYFFSNVQNLISITSTEIKIVELNCLFSLYPIINNNKTEKS